MSDYVVRELLPEDFLEAIELSLKSFGISAFESIESNEKLWLKLFNNNLAKFITAEKNRKLIGVVGLFLFDKVATVGNMCVLQKYRRKGVGTAIFKVLMEKAKKLEYETIELYASEYGEPLYKKFGFQGEHYIAKYQLLTNKTTLKGFSNNIKVLNELPEWLIYLDKQAFGSNRAKYLQIKMELGAKLIVFDDKGYGLCSDGRIGPIIAQDIETAINIIKKSILLGANHLITSKYNSLSRALSDQIKLDIGKSKPDLKMYYGKKLTQDLGYVYAVSSFAKG